MSYLHKVLARALSDDNNGVLLMLEHALQVGEQALFVGVFV